MEKEFNLEQDEKSQESTERKPTEFQPRVDRSIDEIVTSIGSITKPIVVLFGPTQSGKTTALVRLLKYFTSTSVAQFGLNNQFISESFHEKVRNNFNDLVNSENRAFNATENTHFLLIDVFHNHELFCHILEAPGEHFFDLADPTNKTFKNYLTAIFTSDVPKIFVFFFEGSFLSTDTIRVQYSSRVSSVIKLMRKKDSLIFLYNKIDEQPEYIIDGEVKLRPLKDSIYKNSTYKPIFNSIKSSNHIKQVSFVPFSSGNQGDRGTFVLGNNKYPANLWKSIYNSILPKGCLWW